MRACVRACVHVCICVSGRIILRQGEEREGKKRRREGGCMREMVMLNKDECVLESSCETILGGHTEHHTL